MQGLYIDYEKCVGCELCTMRCSLEKTSRVNPAESRIRLVRIEEEGIVMPAVCRHCDEPYCIPACPVNAISKNAETGLVQIDADICTGCKLCLEACPYSGPVNVTVIGKKVSSIKVICDLCNGHPACVEVCPTGTLQFVTIDDAMAERQKQGQERLAKLLTSLGQKS